MSFSLVPLDHARPRLQPRRFLAVSRRVLVRPSEDAASPSSTKRDLESLGSRPISSRPAWPAPPTPPLASAEHQVRLAAL